MNRPTNIHPIFGPQANQWKVRTVFVDGHNANAPWGADLFLDGSWTIEEIEWFAQHLSAYAASLRKTSK